MICQPRSRATWRLQSRQVGAQHALPLDGAQRLLLLLLVGLLGLLGGLGLGFAFGSFLAFDFFLALLDDFGLGWSRGFGGHGLDGLLFFHLESDDVGENLLGIGEKLQLACVNL